MMQEFDIRKYAWHVTVYYLDMQEGDASDEILDDIYRIGCRGKVLDEAERLLRSGKKNTGLTYSNYDRRESVMVIGRSRNASECANTMIHERCHLNAQICTYYGIDPLSEEAAYMAGDIGAKMYDYAHVLLCEGCRKKRFK